MEDKKGKVYIVGAGPGDIGLITLKGLKCLKSAQVVIYDFHINAQILNYIKNDAEFIYAGKKGGHHELSQEEINRIMIQKAKEGKIVCRLKGGDPFVFGRGGEEAEVLSENGIPFEIIPGITSAIAVPAYAGIPLTHREYSSLFTVITGNEDITKPESTINWNAVTQAGGTLVFLMAVRNIDAVTKKLIENGKDPMTPSAVIRWGTRPDQKTFEAPLKDIAEVVKSNNLKPPAILIIGNVVRLRRKLKWYEKKPLFGQRILITREGNESYEILEMLGAEIIELPTVEITPPDDWSELDASLRRIQEFHWLVFTSSNGFRFFIQRLRELNIDIRELRGIKISAVGRSTGEEIKRFCLRVDLIPPNYRAEGLVESLRKIYNDDLRGIRFLFPRADNASEVFPEMIRKIGGIVEAPVAYYSRKPEIHAKRLKRFLKEGRITLTIFTSGATFRNLMEILGDDSVELMRNVRIAALGPVTKKTIESHGFRVDIMPPEATHHALVNEIIKNLINT